LQKGKMMNEKPSLKADFDSGEGDVLFPKQWHVNNDLLKSDILKDWVNLLTQDYDKAMADWRSELEKVKVLQK